MDILIVEDDELDFLAIQRQLKKALAGTEVHIAWINEPETAALKDTIDAFDLCFLDQNMGAVSGLELLRVLTEHGTLTPMILLTGDDNPETDRLAAEYGACDYLVKGTITPDLLTRAIRYCVARKEQERKLVEMALQDPLTGLANRAGFERHLNNARESIVHFGGHLAFFAIDLDDFKKINDTYGHPVGDAVLQEVSRRVSHHVRPDDLVARLGGDEFGVLAKLEDPTTATEVITRNIQSAFTQPIKALDKIIQCRASIGVAVLTTDDAAPSTSDFLRQADIDLYQTKRERKMRRDGTFPRAPHLKPDTDSIAHALVGAETRDELELVFQPKLQDFGRRLSGVEALLRWNHPDMVVEPDVFITLAEKYGSIHEIGRWVLTEACRQQRKWIDAGLAIVPLAVNISPFQIETAEFELQITEHLRRFQLPPDMLELEITEAALMRGLDDRLESMQRIAALGCNWVIDDFGVGHSSLSRLQNLPVSKLKLDRSFLRPLPGDQAVANICNMVINLSRSLGLDMVLEGVETVEQLHMLDLREKDELQGYLYFRPMTADRFAEILQNASASTTERAITMSPAPEKLVKLASHR